MTLNVDGRFDYDPNGAFEALGTGTSQPDSFFYEVTSPSDAAFGAPAVDPFRSTSTGTSKATAGLALDAAALGGGISANTLFVDGGAGAASLGFTAASDAIDYLTVGETVTLGYEITVDDGDGGVDTQAFDVVVTGVNEVTQALADVLLTTELTVLSGIVWADNGSGADQGAALSVVAVNNLTAGVRTEFTLPSGALLTALARMWCPTGSTISTNSI